MKKLSESIWSDMQDRSSGEVVRKEDEFKSICEFIKDHYFVGFVGMDDIEFKDDYIYIPIYKVVGLNAFSSIEIYIDKITFTSIDPNRYKSQSLRKFVTYIKNDINQLFGKIKDTYSPEISTFDGVDHWINFNIKPKNGKVTPKFCEDVIDFILDNTTDGNHKILKILEKEMIPDFKTYINESIWSDMQDRSSGQEIRKEDVKSQDYENWWRNIALDDVPKYKPNELRLYDFLYENIIWKLEKTMNIKNPNMIRIHFRWEDAWYLSIFRNASYGAVNYTLEANGVKHYNPIKYSEMNIDEKRSIRYRLEKRKFYVYPYSNGQWTEYFLRQEEEYKGEKGIPLR